jgi:hypothetical protein
MGSDDQAIIELSDLLDEIDALAPKRSSGQPTPMDLRSTDDAPVEDSISDEPNDLSDAFHQVGAPGHEISDAPTFDFVTGAAVPLAGVDCGIARLGETENGLVIALRATIATEVDTRSRVTLFRTGPLYLHNLEKDRLLLQMGQHLGKPDLFVELEDPDAQPPVVKRLRAGVAKDAHKYGDRFRNWLERLVQRIAVTSVANGVVMFDGALTLRTIDTPSAYLEELARLASSRGNAIVAISKQSMLQVRGRPLPFCLDDVPGKPCYRLLTGLMKSDEAERILGNIYAVRFSSLGPTFRMDVKPVEGQMDAEAINMAFSSSLLRGGYPDILVRAHAHSYFTSPDLLQLQAQASAKYALTPRLEPSLTGIFAPFAGRFK